MAISRRGVLLRGSAIGVGIIAANVPGLVAFAQPLPPLRRSLHGLALNDPILQAWRDGVRLLKARPASDPVSWANFAAIHGSDAGFNLCPHGNWYFLPWHRAYLLMYERTVRQLTGFSDFALPYWDWTLDRQMPQAFVDPTFGGNPNPLFEAQRDASPLDSLPDSTVGQAIINQILLDAPFEVFGTSRPAGQNNLDQSWVNCEFCGTFGRLEQTPHNLVHVFVGGIMGQANSALDAIFMMHHCNIDRIWWMWNQGGGVNSPDPLWTDMTFQNNFFNPGRNRFRAKGFGSASPRAVRLHLQHRACTDSNFYLHPASGCRSSTRQDQKHLRETKPGRSPSHRSHDVLCAEHPDRYACEVSGGSGRGDREFGEGGGEPTIAIERARNAQPRKGADLSRQRSARVRLSARR